MWKYIGVKEKVMILGAGPLQVPAIIKAKELNMYVIVCDYDENAVGFKYADVSLVVSTTDLDGVLEQAQKYRPDYIITSTSDAPVRTVAYVCEKLGMRSDISYENAICATIKSDMRRRLSKYNIPIPEYYVCESFDDFLSAVSNFDAEFIVKPADSAASRGVKLLYDIEDVEKLKKQYEFTKSFSRNGIVMVEEVMHGPEVSVESFIIDGDIYIITITDKLVTERPYFVELGHSEPSQLPSDIQEEIEKLTKMAIRAIGIKNGTSHTEIIVTSSGPKIVEVAARLGGDYITSKLVPLSTGVDMVGNSVLLSLGRHVNITKKVQKGSAIRFITAKKGIISNIVYDKKLLNIPGVVEIVIYCKIGDSVKEVQSSNDRLGHVITQAQNAEEAVKLAESILREIKIEIKSDESS